MWETFECFKYLLEYIKLIFRLMFLQTLVFNTTHQNALLAN